MRAWARCPACAATAEAPEPRIEIIRAWGMTAGVTAGVFDLNVDLARPGGRARPWGIAAGVTAGVFDLNVDWRELQGVQGVRNEGDCGVVRVAASSSLLLFVFCLCRPLFSPLSLPVPFPMAEASWPIAAENAGGSVMGDGSSERGGGDTMAMSGTFDPVLPPPPPLPPCPSLPDSRGIMGDGSKAEAFMGDHSSERGGSDDGYDCNTMRHGQIAAVNSWKDHGHGCRPARVQQQLQGQVVHISASADPPPSCTPPSSPSPLQVVDCEPSSSSCKGGWPTSALDYMVDASNDLGGLVPQLQYPYKGKQAKCNAGKIATSSTPLGLARYEQVYLYGWIGLLLAVQVQPAIVLSLYRPHCLPHPLPLPIPSPAQIATSSTPLGLARYEQVDFYGWIVAAAGRAVESFLNSCWAMGCAVTLPPFASPLLPLFPSTHPPSTSHQGGVYGDPRCAAAGIVDHAVLVVGYAFTGPNGQGNWIVRNSWGTKWGEQGNWTLRNSWGIKWWGEQVRMKLSPFFSPISPFSLSRSPFPSRPYEDGFARSIGISPSPHSPIPPLPLSRSPSRSPFPSRRPYEDGFRGKRWHLRI
ncbi:unnamed protein product [Closterium sp. NIES-64]|nr:unnamed protein product [Closterium sp. NIES-64]